MEGYNLASRIPIWSSCGHGFHYSIMEITHPANRSLEEISIIERWLNGATLKLLGDLRPSQGKSDSRGLRSFWLEFKQLHPWSQTDSKILRKWPTISTSLPGLFFLSESSQLSPWCWRKFTWSRIILITPIPRIYLGKLGESCMLGLIIPLEMKDLLRSCLQTQIECQKQGFLWSTSLITNFRGIKKYWIHAVGFSAHGGWTINFISLVYVPLRVSKKNE